MIFFYSILAGIPLGAFRAWVATCIWSWFVTPEFGLATPSLMVMWGLMIIPALVTTIKPNPDYDVENMFEDSVLSAVGSVIFLATGFILYTIH